MIGADLFSAFTPDRFEPNFTLRQLEAVKANRAGFRALLEGFFSHFQGDCSLVASHYVRMKEDLDLRGYRLGAFHHPMAHGIVSPSYAEPILAG